MPVTPKFTVFTRSVPSKSSVVGSVDNQKTPGVSRRAVQKRHQTPVKLQQTHKRRSNTAAAESVRRVASQETERYGATGVEPMAKRRRPSQAVATGREDSRTRFAQQAQATQETHRQTAKILPQSESLPVWLERLLKLQRRSCVVTFLLAGATLAVYGGTVYTQQLWNREYRQLETLQLQERQLTAASEVFKNQLADQAEQQDTGLVPATPNNNLFLEAPQREKASSTSAIAPKPTPSSQISPTPLGY